MHPTTKGNIQLGSEKFTNENDLQGRLDELDEFADAVDRFITIEDISNLAGRIEVEHFTKIEFCKITKIVIEKVAVS